MPALLKTLAIGHNRDRTAGHFFLFGTFLALHGGKCLEKWYIILRLFKSGRSVYFRYFCQNILQIRRYPEIQAAKTEIFFRSGGFRQALPQQMPEDRQAAIRKEE